MNHKRCSILLKWLQDSGYARTKLCNRKRYFALTQKGYEYARRMQEVNDMTFGAPAANKMYVQNVNELY